MSLSSDWAWEITPNGQYLTCSLLADFAHGFFSRDFCQQTLFDLTGYLNPQAQPFRLKQTHSNQIWSTQAIKAQNIASLDYEAQLPGDALVTSEDNAAVWVCSADCVPLLVADLKQGFVAAIHAGWRGTALGITPLTIQALLAQGSELADLRVAMGPAISGPNYQVDVEVAVQLGKTLLSSGSSDSGLINPETQPKELAKVLSYLSSQDPSPIDHDAHPDKVRLDVRRINELQLRKLGMSPEQITTAPYCTYSDERHFFSYRREHRKQVQWSGIVSKN